MGETLEYRGEERRFVAGIGWIEPGQHIDVDDETATVLGRRRDFRTRREDRRRLRREEGQAG